VKGVQHVPVHNGSETIEYPADMGAHCEAWDDNVISDCKEGETPGKGKDWCAQSWCYVDPCRCKGEMHKSLRMAAIGVNVRGVPLFYSYETCGSTDYWTSRFHAGSCAQAKEEMACYERDSCMWDKGACHSLEETVCEIEADASEWGHHECRCVLPEEIEGTYKVQKGGKSVEVEAGFGSTCGQWHAEAHGEASCKKSPNSTTHCDAMWCYVDQRDCADKFEPTVSSYLPDAKFGGHTIGYSYITCGSEPPPTTAPPSTTTPPPEKKEDEATTTTAAPETTAPIGERAPCRGCPNSTKENPYNKQRGEPLYNYSRYEDDWGSEYKQPMTRGTSP
jgi:hypothetical protein